MTNPAPAPNPRIFVPGAPFLDVAPQLTDSFSGVDIYGKGFVTRPTLFFDPSQAGISRNLGTYKNPYTTVAQLQAVIAGNMAGQTLGMKRGMFLRAASGLSLTCYGSSTAPFSIVPYGDGGPLPIITGSTVRNGWTVYGSDARLWQQTGISQAVDVFEKINGVYQRLWGCADVAGVISYISAPVAGTVGAYTWVSNILYIYLNDGSNPNLGQIETADATYALGINFPDVSGTGNVTVAGISVALARNTAIDLRVSSNANTNAPANITVVGCQAGLSGCQLASGLAADGICVNGGDSAINTNVYVAGNYCYQALNNAVEINCTNGATVEKNVGYICGGNSILEMWALDTNFTVRFNRGYGDVLRSQRQSNVSAYHGSGIWANNNSNIAGGAQSNTLNGGHTICFNYSQDATTWGIDNSGGQNNNIFNNTFLTKNATTSVSARFAGATSATGHIFKNNLCVADAGETFATFARVFTTGGDATTPTPTMDYNAYYNISKPDSSGGAWQIGATQYFNIGNWRTIASGEAHSQSTLGTSPTIGLTLGSLLDGNGTAWLGSNTDYSLSGSSAQAAGTSIVSSGYTRDTDGRAIANTGAPNIGALQM